MREFRGPRNARVFVFSGGMVGAHVNFVVYLDEFGHIGPFISRVHLHYNESPVFGLAGLVLPVQQVRHFGTWFFQRKQELLAWEIAQAQKHPALWEKKGSSLYTLKNVEKYPELRKFTNRFMNKIENVGGHVFYVGVEKTSSLEQHDANALYVSILREAIKRWDQFCEDDIGGDSGFLLVLDEHDQRERLVTAAAQAMYQAGEPRRHLIEPPFQVESHRYQTVQAADWIAGLTGRIAAIWAKPDEYADWLPIRRYFEARLNRAALRSGVRTGGNARFEDGQTDLIVQIAAEIGRTDRQR